MSSSSIKQVYIPLLLDNYSDKIDPKYQTEALKEGNSFFWNHAEVWEHIQLVAKISFPQTIFHSVLSICGIFIDPITHKIMDGFRSTIPKVDSYVEFQKLEKKLLEDFWKFSIKYENHNHSWYENEYSTFNDFQKKKMKKIPVTFSGYNIFNFDLPVIEQRSLKYFITCPIKDYLFNLSSDSYRYKYASDKIFDLLSYVANYDNRNAKIGLDILAKSMGLGGKLQGMDGSKVFYEYFEKNNSEKIEEYCAIDVLTTYSVYLAIQKSRGILDETKFTEIRKWFYDWLLLEHKPQSYKELARSSSQYFLRS